MECAMWYLVGTVQNGGGIYYIEIASDVETAELD